MQLLCRMRSRSQPDPSEVEYRDETGMYSPEQPFHARVAGSRRLTASTSDRTASPALMLCARQATFDARLYTLTFALHRTSCGGRHQNQGTATGLSSMHSSIMALALQQDQLHREHNQLIPRGYGEPKAAQNRKSGALSTTQAAFASH